MILDREIIEDVLAAFFRRCEAIKMAGGIALKDVLEGTKVPTGWHLDAESDYYVPPNFHFTNDVQ